MASRSPKDSKLSSTGGIALYGLHFIFDAFGATRPVRLGLAIALSLALNWPTRILAVGFGVPLPGGFILEYSLFGLSFCVFFLTFLHRPPLPEAIAEQFVVIESFAKQVRISRAEKRQMYRDLYGVIISRNGHLPQLHLSHLKEDHKKKIGGRVE